MPTSSFNISYAAHTSSCTFLLDNHGICRRVVMVPSGRRRESSQSATRCVGAQYVASLDGGAAGGLVEMPRVGYAMLFARTDERGRISLVRTGVVTSFESHADEDPFQELPSVETSAPALAAALSRGPRATPAEREAPRFDPGARTQRIRALRPEQIAAAPADSQSDSAHDLVTAEYCAPELPTVHLRAAPPRGALPRRSDPKMRAAAAATQAWAPPPPARAPRAHDPEMHLATRRRRGV